MWKKRDSLFVVLLCLNYSNIKASPCQISVRGLGVYWKQVGSGWVKGGGGS